MTDELPLFRALRTGQQAEVSRRFSRQDLDEWSTMAGLDAPVPQVPEPLVAGLFSFLLGERLPGHGTNYLKQSLNFENQADADEPLIASVRITRLHAAKALVYLDTRCTGNDERPICTGEALVLFQH